MALNDFKFYAGMSPELFINSIGLPTDGYQLIWHRAEDITPVDDGYAFEYWPEALRGNLSGYRLAQSNPSARLVYYSNQLNGYPIVRGAVGGSSWMAGESALFTADILTVNCYIFVVKKQEVSVSATYGIAGSSSNQNLRLGSTGSNIALRFGSSSLVSTISDTNWYVAYGHRLTTGTARNLVGADNLDLAISATNPSAATPNFSLRLWANDTGTGVESGITENVYMAEGIILIGNANFILTDDQISAINYYLSSKYNIPLKSPEIMNRFYYNDAKNSFRPQLHESLSNPLPFESDGYFCRSAELPAGGLDGYTTITRHSLSDGYMVGLDNNTAISIRAWVRVAGLVPDGKSQIVLFTHLDDPWKGYSEDTFIGYGLKFGTIANGEYSNLALRIALRDSDGYYDLSYPDIECSGTYSENEWYRVRMDVIPIGGAEDRITVYTGIGETDSEVWTPVGSVTVQSVNSVYRSKSDKNEQGYFVSHVDKDNSYLTTKYYIDRFQVRIKDV